MTRFIRSLLAALLSGLAFSASAGAQVPAGAPCANPAQVTEHLHQLYGERRVGHGLAANGLVIELFAGPSGSFTLFATTPRGMSCLIISGDSWEPAPQPEHHAAR